MLLPDPPALALTDDYVQTHGADTSGCGERRLWRAVVAQAAADLWDKNPSIQRDAVAFFRGPGLLQIMDYAGIDRAVAPALRERALAIQQQPERSRRRIFYRGRAYTYQELSQATGLSKFTIIERVRRGMSIEQAVSMPVQQAMSRRRIAPTQLSPPTGPTAP